MPRGVADGTGNVTTAIALTMLSSAVAGTYAVTAVDNRSQYAVTQAFLAGPEFSPRRAAWFGRLLEDLRRAGTDVVIAAAGEEWSSAPRRFAATGPGPRRCLRPTRTPLGARPVSEFPGLLSLPELLGLPEIPGLLG